MSKTFPDDEHDTPTDSVALDDGLRRTATPPRAPRVRGPRAVCVVVRLRCPHRERLKSAVAPRSSAGICSARSVLRSGEQRHLKIHLRMRSAHANIHMLRCHRESCHLDTRFIFTRRGQDYAVDTVWSRP